jgi:hypothetical protein
VQIITFDELEVELARQPRSDRSLSGARDAHHDEQPRVHSDLSYTAGGFQAILLAA